MNQILQHFGRRLRLGLHLTLILIASEVPAAETIKSIPVTRSSVPHQYLIEVDMRLHTPKQAEPQSITYRIALDCVPVANSNSDGQLVTYRCRDFKLLRGCQPPVTIPTLKDWSYQFAWPSTNTAPEGNAFGMPMSKFLGLKDSTGRNVDGMLVYNAFTDYHVLCNIYAQPLAGGGVQDLQKVGQQIVHATANSVTPLAGAPGLLEGSEFRHGKVLLDWMGQSRIDGKLCALLGFDSGQNENRLVMQPRPDLRIESVGYSQHRGQLYIDAESGWVRKASMMEVVVNRRETGDRQSPPLVIERYLKLEKR